MNQEFVHLHVHTDFSMLDGACRVADLADMAKHYRMPAVACTDHGNMCGAIEFYRAMLEKGIKPILGCEFYVAPASRTERNPQAPHVQGFHLVLLAEDMEGYRNLCRLNAEAWLRGFYYKPRIDKEILAEHSHGLIALSACIAGEVPARILEGDHKLAARALHDYLDIFGKDRFYLELQEHGLADQETANKGLIGLAEEYAVPLVVTNDVHYLQQEHATAHDVLLCIGTQATLDEPKRLRFNAQEFYFKSPEQMAALFPQHPEALSNTLAIAERCNVVLPLDNSHENHYPVYTVPDEEPREPFIRRLCIAGLRDRFGIDATNTDLPEKDRAVVDRMDYELQIIANAKFVSYFLVVWDFLHFAREQGIPIGPGRGSGAGSLVAYLLHITDIDPLRYGLLFERFLNPDRVSPPDFDIDLCERRRQEVIAYVRDKYGADSVAQIGTFGTLKAKAVIKDVARVLGRPFADGNEMAKTIPDDPKVTLTEAMEKSHELREMAENQQWVSQCLDYSEVLEGLNRNMSIHAAGVIIGDQPLTNLVPLGKGANEEVITQYSAGPCEALGLLKMDFLGLRTLTIIQDTLDLIEQNHGIQLESAEIPLDDPATFELLNKGNTVAVFQLESGGMRDLCRRFGVRRIEDIIALIALYRPGPMRFLDDFIARKMGETTVEYDVPEMRPILSETYGIMLYQEQVMQVVQKVAGFTLGQADILRRAMGKKKAMEMEQQFDRFMAGCAANRIEEQTAKHIWDKIVLFADYGFNKSHSAAYAMLSYRTGFLKANYPTEFMAAVLSSELGNADKLSFFLKECGAMSIEVSPPDVNTSDLRFSVDGKKIRFGLGAIKGVGGGAAEAIIEARRNGGPFAALTELCERVEGLNKRVAENLCKAGAFDCFGLRRSQIFAVIDQAMAIAQQRAQDRRVGQGLLFDLGTDQATDPLFIPTPDLPEWEQKELLGYEKELLGFYVTGHPIAEYTDMLDTYQIDSISRLDGLTDHTSTRIGGIITSLDLKRSKRDNRPWSILTLEGLEGTVECLVYADAHAANSEVLQPEAPVLVEGSVDRRDGDRVKIIVDRVIPMAQAPELLAKEVHVRIHQASSDQERLRQLLQTCRANAGETPLVLCLICLGGEIAFVQPQNTRIRNTQRFRQTVRDLFGEECLLEKADKTRKNNSANRPQARFRNKGQPNSAENARRHY